MSETTTTTTAKVETASVTALRKMNGAARTFAKNLADNNAAMLSANVTALADLADATIDFRGILHANRVKADASAKVPTTAQVFAALEATAAMPDSKVTLDVTRAQITTALTVPLSADGLKASRVRLVDALRRYSARCASTTRDGVTSKRVDATWGGFLAFVKQEHEYRVANPSITSDLHDANGNVADSKVIADRITAADKADADAMTPVSTDMLAPLKLVHGDNVERILTDLLTMQADVAAAIARIMPTDSDDARVKAARTAFGAKRRAAIAARVAAEKAGELADA